MIGTSFYSDPAFAEFLPKAIRSMGSLVVVI